MVVQSITAVARFSEVETICDYGDSFEELQLICNANKPLQVLPNLIVTWFQDDMLVDEDYEQSSGGAVVTNTLFLNSSESSNGGNYTCVAEIVIPESPNITESIISQVPRLGKLQTI